jgi:GxxExxY protein
MLEASQDVEQLAHRVIGAAIEVHKHLGPGFLESAYEEALAVELGLRRIAFRRQFEIDVSYKGRAIATQRIDLLIEDKLVVEIKAVEGIVPVHIAQTLSYLSAYGLELGLILNFNVPSLNERGIRRVIRSIHPE